MTEIKLCNDKAKLYEIWRERFHDKNETIDLFFNLSYKNAFTLAVFVDSSPVSVLYALPEKILSDGKEFNALYIYAAATKKSFERRGYMTKLLEYAGQFGKERNYDYLFLVPASKALEKYYTKRGFYPAFKEFRVNYSSKEASFASKYKKYETINRNNFTKALSTVNWSNSECELSKKYSDFHFSNENIWSTGRYNGDILQLTDCIIKNISLKEAFELIQGISGAKKITADIPYEFKNQAESLPLKETFKGMALNLSSSVPLLSTVYLGFTLA